MEYTSIYRRFRPKTFDNVIGQEHIVRTLTNQIKAEQIGHAYLFTGTRGTGKTSCAKILARAVNCLNPVNGSPCGQCAVCKELGKDNNGVDIIEIDAASNNGVDEIRAIKENVLYRPTIGRYKVYIIDEVHMLSTAAFNALLKTLEEPPEHIIFILATTEVQKLPQTILSRCIRFDFRLIEVDTLVGLLKRIFSELNVKYDERALIKIAVQGEGSVRDTLSTADMCLSYCGNEIKYEDVLEVLCATDFDTLANLAQAILSGETGKALGETERLLRLGRTTLARDLANYCKELVSVKNIPDYKPQSMTENERKILERQCQPYSNYRLSRVMELMAGMENKLRFASQPRILMEATIVRACELVAENEKEDLIGRITDAEVRIGNIEKNGIRVTTNGGTGIVNAEPQRETIKEEKKTDVKEILKTVGKEINEQPIFEENKEELASKKARAKEIWSRMKEKINASNEFTLKLVCESIEGDVDIDDGMFKIITKDNATYEMLRKQGNVEYMNKLLMEETNGELKFLCEKPDEEGLSGPARTKLNDLFNGKVRFRN